MEKLTKEEIKDHMQTVDYLLWWLKGFSTGVRDAGLPDEWETTLIIVYNLLKEKQEKVK